MTPPPPRKPPATGLLLCSLLLSASCLAPIRIESRALAPPPASSSILGPRTFDWADYDLCLKRVVVDGRVEYCCLLDRDEPLERTLAHLARSGPQQSPELFATGADRLAYWVNAYNAAVLRAAEELTRPLVVRGDLQRLLSYRPARDPDHGFIFTIDGRQRTPADLRAEAERLADADWRVRFALCGGHLGDPPLFREAYLPDVLDHQLDETVRLAIEQPQIVKIDHGLQRLLICRPLAQARTRLVNDWKSRHAAPTATLLNVLLDWSTPEWRASLNSAIGYDERTLPFDDRINQAPFQPPPN